MYGITQEFIRPEFAADWTHEVNPRDIPYLSYYDYYNAYTYYNSQFAVYEENESLESANYKRKRESDTLFDVIESLETRPMKRLKLECGGEEISEQLVKSTIIDSDNEANSYQSYDFVESPSCSESSRSEVSYSTELNSSTDLANDQGGECLTPNPMVWKLLKDALSRYKIYQKQLADDLRVSASTVSAYLTRKGRLNGWAVFEAKVEQWLSIPKKEHKIRFVNCSITL